MCNYEAILFIAVAYMYTLLYTHLTNHGYFDLGEKPDYPQLDIPCQVGYGADF